MSGGEFAFAASGTCVATVGKKWAWIGTNARILKTTDQGETWAAYESPIPPGPTGTGGVFSVDFRNPARGVVGGGDFLATDIVDNFARSHNGGKTWELGTNAPIPGAIFGLDYVGTPGRPRYIVATGPAGAAWTPDEGDTWNLLEGVEGFWAVAFASPDAGWLVGVGGTHSEGQLLKGRSRAIRGAARKGRPRSEALCVKPTCGGSSRR